jgi:hypothetical protein
MVYKLKPWTQEERYTLKKYYGAITIDALLLKLPGRTEQSIYSQVHNLRKRGWTFNKRK